MKIGRILYTLIDITFTKISLDCRLTEYGTVANCTIYYYNCDRNAAGYGRNLLLILNGK